MRRAARGEERSGAWCGGSDGNDWPRAVVMIAIRKRLVWQDFMARPLWNLSHSDGWNDTKPWVGEGIPELLAVEEASIIEPQASHSR